MTKPELMKLWFEYKLVRERIEPPVNHNEERTTISAKIEELTKLIKQDRYTNRDSYAQKRISDLKDQLNNRGKK